MRRNYIKWEKIKLIGDQELIVEPTEMQSTFPKGEVVKIDELLKSKKVNQEKLVINHF